MTCPDCGAPNPEEAQLCGSCGRSLFYFPPGTVLGARYEIQEILGSGGLGRVYRARDRMLEETVAVKVLHPEAGRSPEFARRFRSEIKLARKVRHRNVCAIHEYGEEGGLRFVAMELVEGRDLGRIIREAGPFSTAEAFDVAMQVAEGLSAVHDAGVIHRDLKTPNIMRDRDGVVRLLDFGIAKLMAPTGTLALTGIQKVVGTPEYMSPEQIRGEELDARSDLYSLGIVIYELFTGFVPFQGRTPVDTLLRQVNEPPPLYGDMAARIPRELVPVLSRTLSKKPEDRPVSSRQLLQALRAVRGTVVPDAAPIPPRLSPPAPSPGGSPLERSPEPRRTPPPLPSHATGPLPPLVTPPPVVRTTALPRPGGAPGQAGGVGGPPPLPPLTPRPPTRTAREDAAAAALDAGRTFVELPVAEGPRGGAPEEMGRPPALPAAKPTGLLSRIRSTVEPGVRPVPPAVGLSLLAVIVLFASWLAFGPRRSSPPKSLTSPPSTMAPGMAPPSEKETPGPVAVVSSATSPAPIATEAPSASPPARPEATATPAPTPPPTPRPRRVRQPPAPPPPTPTPTPSPSPTPAPATVDIDVHPWADIRMGDQLLGRTPIEARSLEPGPVVLSVEHPDFWPLRRRVVLEPGRRTRLQVDLQWEAIPRGKVDPYEVPPGDTPDDPYFQSGVRLIAEGDLQEAILTLDPVVRRLEARDRSKELARAEFFLGVALLEAGREVEARERFESALTHDRSLRPNPAAFPTRVTTFFRHVQGALKTKKR